MDTFATHNKKLAGYKDVSDTVKIIEKIAASQLHELQKKTTSLSEYTKHILALLVRMHKLTRFATPDLYPVFTTPRSLLVIITGDKGLVGDLWRRLFDVYVEDVQQDMLIIGKKGAQHWIESVGQVTHYSFAGRIPTSDELCSLAKLLDEHVDTGMYNTISTLHIHPTSLVEQNPVLTPLLPIDMANIEPDVIDPVASEYPIVDGSLLSLQKTLYKKYLSNRLQQIILETAVSEYSARTVAMEHASTKTDEANKRLIMVYSRDRRQRETQKQLERFATKHTTI